MLLIPAWLNFLNFFLYKVNYYLKFIFDQSFAGFDEDSAGFRQGSANYLGSNRILRGSWPHAPPPPSYTCTVYNVLFVLYTV